MLLLESGYLSHITRGSVFLTKKPRNVTSLHFVLNNISAGICASSKLI